MASYNVRVSAAAHRALRQFAAAEGRPIQAVLDEALQDYRRQKFWNRTNAAFQALKHNKTAWKDQHAERLSWDRTLLDGLEEK